MLTATFVRRRASKDHVYVVRSDATTVDWAFPSYGDGLPHDLCHLVVEEGLGLSDGFWGLVDAHVEVRLVDNQATLVRHGLPLAEVPDFDFSGLRRAEDAVALLAPPVVAVALDDHDQWAAADVSAITDRLCALGHQWRALEDGASLTLGFWGRP